jgi:hypothetical protein
MATILIVTPVLTGLLGSAFWGYITMKAKAATARTDAAQAGLDIKNAALGMRAADAQLAEVFVVTTSPNTTASARCDLFLSQDHPLSCYLSDALNSGSLIVDILSTGSVQFPQFGGGIQSSADLQYVPTDVSTIIHDTRALLRDSSRNLQALRVPVSYANTRSLSVSAVPQTASVAEGLQTVLKDLSFAAASIREAGKATDGAIAAAKESQILELVLGSSLIPVAFTIVGGGMPLAFDVLLSEGKHTKSRAV